MDIYKIIHPTVSVTELVSATAEADGIVDPTVASSGSIIDPTVTAESCIIKPTVTADGIVVPELVRLILTGGGRIRYLYPDTLYPGTLYPVGE